LAEARSPLSVPKRVAEPDATPATTPAEVPSVAVMMVLPVRSADAMPSAPEVIDICMTVGSELDHVTRGVTSSVLPSV
jgi:hypothetical protein